MIRIRNARERSIEVASIEIFENALRAADALDPARPLGEEEHYPATQTVSKLRQHVASYDAMPEPTRRLLSAVDCSGYRVFALDDGKLIRIDVRDAWAHVRCSQSGFTAEVWASRCIGGRLSSTDADVVAAWISKQLAEVSP